MEMENSKSHILSLSLYQDYNHSQKLQAFTDSLRRNSEKNQGFPGASSVKNWPAMQETQEIQVCRFSPWVRKIPWRRKRQPALLAKKVSWTEEPGGSQRV